MAGKNANVNINISKNDKIILKNANGGSIAQGAVQWGVFPWQGCLICGERIKWCVTEGKWPELEPELELVPELVLEPELERSQRQRERAPE